MGRTYMEGGFEVCKPVCCFWGECALWRGFRGVEEEDAGWVFNIREEEPSSERKERKLLDVERVGIHSIF